ncbi:MAG: hypothetical protein AAB569_04980 [Patescibacteria group bacterium]
MTPAFYIITREIAREYFRNIKKAFGDKDVSKDTTYTTGLGCVAISALFLVGLCETPFAIALEGPIDIVRAIRSRKSKK